MQYFIVGQKHSLFIYNIAGLTVTTRFTVPKITPLTILEMEKADWQSSKSKRAALADTRVTEETMLEMGLKSLFS